MTEERDAEAKRVGSVITGLRLAKGWSQEDLAREIKVSVGTVSRWERGKHEGYGRNVSKLAKALAVAPAVLRPVPPDTETQLDRIESKLDDLLAALLGDAGDPSVRTAAAEAVADFGGQAAEIAASQSTPSPGRAQSPSARKPRKSA